MRKAEQPHLGGRPSSLQNSIALASVFLRVLYPDYQPSSFSCALLSLLNPSNCFEIRVKLLKKPRIVESVLRAGGVPIVDQNPDFAV
jgi:hypothetical protein